MAVPINSELIKNAFKEKGLSMSATSRLFGYGANTISAALSSGKMQEGMLDKIILLLNLKKEDIILQDEAEQVDAKQEKPDTETDKIISYICDIGKIQTDILRELKTIHDDAKQLLTAVNTNIIDTTSELHQAVENVKNHAVATNQNMNKIHNLMKYGGK